MLSSRIQLRASTEPPGPGSKPATCTELSAASATDPVPVRLGEAAGMRIAPRAVVEGAGIAVGVGAGIEGRMPEEGALDHESVRVGFRGKGRDEQSQYRDAQDLLSHRSHLLVDCTPHLLSFPSFTKRSSDRDRALRAARAVGIVVEQVGRR